MRRVAFALAILLAPFALPAAPATGACPGAAQASFVGLVHDDARATSFRADVGNLEEMRDLLLAPYACADAEILAFDADDAARGTLAATEENLLAALARHGAAAASTQGSVLFLVISTHGLPYVGDPPCAAAAPRVGSVATLAGGDRLHDCELADILATTLPAHGRAVIVVDCSLCGGFADAATVLDGRRVAQSGVAGPGRIVITGCTMTTECLGQPDGSILFRHLLRALRAPHAADGTTSLGFPEVEDPVLPVRSPLLRPQNGELEASEWFHAAAASALARGDLLGVQQQFRMRHGAGPAEPDLRLA